MRTKLATYVIAGGLGLSGVAGVAALTPAIAYAATGTTDAVSDRVGSIKIALAGLVSNGTITQTQADSVASSLAESLPARGGHRGGGGWRGVDLAAAAEALGVTEAELRTAGEAGKTLADVAAAEGVSEDSLVDALVAAQQERLDAAVAAGRLTQAEADTRAADLETRITAALDQPICGPGGGRGPRDGDDAPAPSGGSATATPAPQATSSAA